MTKFENFLFRYDIKLKVDNCDSKTKYRKYKQWETGEHENPTLSSIREFFELFKDQINYDMLGLIKCFDTDFDKMAIKPYIFSFVSRNCKIYKYYFINYILKKLNRDYKILVIDENIYPNISESVKVKYNDKDFEGIFLQKDIMTGPDLFSIENIEEIKKYKRNTKHNNVDYIKITDIYKNDLSYFEIKKTYDSIKKILKRLTYYDMILINSSGSNYRNRNIVINRVSDINFCILGTQDSMENNYRNEVLNNNCNFVFLRSKFDLISNRKKAYNLDDAKATVKKSKNSFEITGRLSYFKEEGKKVIIDEEVVYELEEFYTIFYDVFNSIL